MVENQFILYLLSTRVFFLLMYDFFLVIFRSLDTCDNIAGIGTSRLLYIIRIFPQIACTGIQLPGTGI